MRCWILGRELESRKTYQFYQNVTRVSAPLEPVGVTSWVTVAVGGDEVSIAAVWHPGWCRLGGGRRIRLGASPDPYASARHDVPWRSARLEHSVPYLSLRGRTLFGSTKSRANAIREHQERQVHVPACRPQGKVIGPRATGSEMLRRQHRQTAGGARRGAQPRGVVSRDTTPA
jgi:hypothetical protein